MSDREDDRAALLALFSQHLPEVNWDRDEHMGYIGCSCGRGLYVGHVVGLILDRFHGEEMAEWERELLEEMDREQRRAHLSIVEEPGSEPA